MKTNENSQASWQERFKNVSLKLLAVLMTLLWLVLVGATWAEAGEDSPSQSDEYNFNWLDPDKKIYVLQNRRYTKAGKTLLSAMVGQGVSSPYRTSYNLDPRLAHYFSESLGVELFYGFTFNNENGNWQDFQEATTAMPIVREIRSKYGVLAHWVPWYAKINVFNQILYFDWYFSGGVGSIKTARDNRANSRAAASYLPAEDFLGLFLGTGHQYHLSNGLLIRMDVTGSFYRASRISGSSSWRPTYDFGLGVGVRL
jgi:outer membrane beta-barrel protein